MNPHLKVLSGVFIDVRRAHYAKSPNFGGQRNGAADFGRCTHHGRRAARHPRAAARSRTPPARGCRGPHRPSRASLSHCLGELDERVEVVGDGLVGVRVDQRAHHVVQARRRDDGLDAHLCHVLLHPGDAERRARSGGAEKRARPGAVEGAAADLARASSEDSVTRDVGGVRRHEPDECVAGDRHEGGW